MNSDRIDKSMATDAARLLRSVGAPLSRREMLRRCLFGTGGLLLLNGWGTRAFAAAPGARAKSVIQIWLWGGPCHLDTFDPKPEAGRDYCGTLDSPIETNVAGMRISQLLPNLAKQADKYSLLRSMTHGNNGHETAAYLVQTGRDSGEREVYPSAGAVVSLFKGYGAGYTGTIPPYIVLTQPQGRFSEAGFLGNKHKPFATGGDPGKAQFEVEGIVAPGITEKRQRQRRELLHELNTLGQTMPGDATLNTLYQSEEQAYELILGDAGKLFDLAQEQDDLRDRYGRTTFGQSCLMARRLVEKGVPYITINYQGWDTHKQHFQTMSRKLPELDKGLATLLQDLSDHGLLDRTIVWVSGEFGRTPKVQTESPWNGGRGHWGKVFSALVAGGGFQGGQIIGASDARGEEVKERPIYPVDLLGSVYDLLGIDGTAKLPHPQGLDLRVLPTAPGFKSGGRLREIMPS
jgi:hypothetical protein